MICMSPAPYNWLDKSVCDDYANVWELSLDEVHYGWLAPGEKSIQLLADIPPGSRVLDVGCGMGENVVALKKLHLNSHGIDISDHMPQRARKNLRLQKVNDKEINKKLRTCDVRNLRGEFHERFQSIISVYALEFLPNVTDFQKSVDEITERLDKRGTFIFCVAHPTTHPDYPMLTNQSRSMSVVVPTLLYSVRDVVQSVCNAGLVVERIIEQETRNPSRMTYAEGCQFPYHFRQDRNPFHPLFDQLNNANPHTLIYKTRKQD